MADAKVNTSISFNAEKNDKNPKFVIKGGYQNKNIFAKGYTPNWCKVFVVKNFRNTRLWAYVTENFRGDEVVGIFSRRNFKRPIKQGLGLRRY